MMVCFSDIDFFELCRQRRWWWNKIYFECFLTFLMWVFMLELNPRENMKSIHRFLVMAVALVSLPALATSYVPNTVGSNLTAYNPGAMNNNNWNSLMNNRSSGGAAPTADFGNCNALILRCAQPKCATGGCSSLDVTRPIVTGCVKSNATCEQYGADLIEYIAAQLVANSTAKANQQAADAQVAAAQAAAAQNSQQMQQMQYQMQQMQEQMAAQNAETVAQLQNALAEQKQMTADAMAAQTASSSSAMVSETQAEIAAASGVSADVLMREQISGQILSQIENAETAMKALKVTMNNLFEYAGCDSSGNNCTGPKRVKAFKNKAMQFFEPYNTVLDEMYDALVLAQSVGADVTEIYLLLNDACNAWGEYVCQGDDLPNTSVNNGKKNSCQLVRMIGKDEDVTTLWVNNGGKNDGGSIRRIGCASQMLDDSALFKNRRKQATIDIETLQRIIEADAPAVRRGGNVADSIAYCATGDDKIAELSRYATLKKLPNQVCVSERKIKDNVGVATSGIYSESSASGGGDAGVSMAGLQTESEVMKKIRENQDCTKRYGTVCDSGCCCGNVPLLSGCTCSNGKAECSEVSLGYDAASSVNDALKSTLGGGFNSYRLLN